MTHHPTDHSMPRVPRDDARARVARRAIATASLFAVGIAAVRTASGAPAGVPRPVRETTFASDVAPGVADFRRPQQIPDAPDNRLTPARVDLGKALFFDPRLSRSGMLSCASCHNPSLGWSDGMSRAVGDSMKTLARRTPTILDLAWASALFWDGRAETLEEQALGPIAATGEMNLPLDSLRARIASIRGYQALFDAAYRGEGVTPKTIARAIASFERTVVSERAPFDRWVAGDRRAISSEASAGFALFAGKANCAKCHSGWRFTDDSFHDIGVPGADSGRVKIIEIPATEFAFKTPTLRGVASRPPYMHNGSEATLESVVELYDRGGRVHRSSLSPEIKPLGLSATEKHAIVAFLRTLDAAPRPVTLPALPR